VFRELHGETNAAAVPFPDPAGYSTARAVGFVVGPITEVVVGLTL